MDRKISSIIILVAVLLAIAPAAAENTAVDPGVVVIIAAFPDRAQTDPHFQFQQGDTINFTGTNTGSRTTYLFLTGSNLKANGSQIQSEYPAGDAVIEGDAATFAKAAVDAEGRWSFAWDTKKSTLSPGVYTIYAVSKPHDKGHLELTPYGTTSVMIGKPQSQAMGQQEKYTLEETIAISPGGPVTTGTPVTVTSTINFVLTGAQTFPWDHDIVISTGLDNPQWSYSLVLDGVTNSRPAVPGKTLDLSGFELSFPGSVNEERIVVTLQGTAPAVREGRTKNAVRISVVDSTGNIVPNSTVTREITVLPSPGTTPGEPTLTPTTAPMMHP